MVPYLQILCSAQHYGDFKRLHVNIPKVRYSDMGNKAE